MLRIERIDHIGMAVPDLEGPARLFEGLFGFRREDEHEDPVARQRTVTFAVPGEHGVRWELVQPTEGSAPLQEFLDGPRGPGLHHVAIEVPDVGEAVQVLRERGIEATEPRAGAHNGGREVAIEPDRGGAGLQFLLVEASDGSKPPATDSAAQDHTLGIIAVDHISQAYPDRDELAEHLGKVLGMKQIWRTPDGEHDDFADLVLEWPGAQLLWEVIMPIGDESFIRRFLDRRGPSVHHVAFQVADWERAIEACRHHGIDYFDVSEGETDGGAWRDAFIHPRDTGGILVQFFWEERPATWIRSDKVRPDGFGG